MEKKSNAKKVLAEINGFKIMSDTVYEVIGRLDTSAPQAFQDANIAKAPFPENATHVCCPWDDFSKTYNTGFYPRSRCYRGMSEEEIKYHVEQRVENIKKPYEEATQSDLSQTNFEFWDDAKERIFMGKLFNTNDPVDLLFFYISVFSGMLMPRELDGDPTYMNAMFGCAEKGNFKDIVQQREINKMNVGYKFIDALKRGGKDRQAAIDLLLYIGIVTRPDFTEDDYYVGSLTNWMGEKKTNVDYLLEIWDRSLNTEFKEVLEFYRIINVLQRSGRISMTPAGLQYNGQVIGPDVRVSAENVAVDDKMLEVKAALLVDYDEIMAMGNIDKKTKPSKKVQKEDAPKSKEDAPKPKEDEVKDDTNEEKK